MHELCRSHDIRLLLSPSAPYWHVTSKLMCRRIAEAFCHTADDKHPSRSFVVLRFAMFRKTVNSDPDFFQRVDIELPSFHMPNLKSQLSPNPFPRSDNYMARAARQQSERTPAGKPAAMKTMTENQILSDSLVLQLLAEYMSNSFLFFAGVCRASDKRGDRDLLFPKE